MRMLVMCMLFSYGDDVIVFSFGGDAYALSTARTDSDPDAHIRSELVF